MRGIGPQSPASWSIECEHMKENPRYYRHFTGGKYKVLAIGQDSETLAPVVVYQALYGDHKVWARFVLRCRVIVDANRPLEGWKYGKWASLLKILGIFD